MAAVTKIDGEGPGSGEISGELGALVHERVYQRLREALITGRLAPGRSLSVRGLAAEFDVSAMPAREAIRRLEALGALEFTNTRRVKVAQMTSERLDEIKSARLALEPLLAERALQQVAGDTRERKGLVRQLEKIDASLDAAIRRGDANKYSLLNSEFHFTLYRAAQASVLLELVESLWLRFGPLMRLVIGRLGTSCLKDDHHKEIISALSAADAELLKAVVSEDLLHGMNNIDESDFAPDGRR